jgi:putative NADH-flavin reductase
MAGVFFILTRMQITVFGASGKVGRLVVAEALRRGLQVRALVHSHNPFDEMPGLTVLIGDIYRAEDISQALKGADVVVSCLGSWGTVKRNVLTTAMEAIIPTMQEQKITRIVTLTGSGALTHRKPNIFHRALMALLAPLPAGKVFADGEQHMRLLAESGLEWTTIRSPLMNNLDGTGYRLTARMGNHLRTISRVAVANCLLDQLDSDEWLRQTPIIRRSGQR